MKYTVQKVLVAGMLCALALGSAGCARESSAAASAKPGMGMGGGAVSGMSAGAIAASRCASMSQPTFNAAAGSVEVPKLTAPAEGWLVVRSTAPTAGVLGYAPVHKGENRNISVSLSAADTLKVRVGIFVDRGVRGTFEFNPDRPASALDKPVVVGGALCESPLMLTGWGAAANPGTALLMVEDQPAGASLEVGYLIVPGDSWIEVRRIEKGVPGQRVGLLVRPAGEFHRVSVPVKGVRPRDELLVTLLADRGVIGRFEPTTGSPYNAVDQPWVSAGSVASQRVRLR